MVSTHPKVQTIMEKILIKMVDDMVANGKWSRDELASSAPDCKIWLTIGPIPVVTYNGAGRFDNI